MWRYYKNPASAVWGEGLTRTLEHASTLTSSLQNFGKISACCLWATPLWYFVTFACTDEDSISLWESAIKLLPPPTLHRIHSCKSPSDLHNTKPMVSSWASFYSASISVILHSRSLSPPWNSVFTWCPGVYCLGSPSISSLILSPPHRPLRRGTPRAQALDLFSVHTHSLDGHTYVPSF